MAIEELAGEVVEEVANNLEEAAAFTRRFNPSGVGYLAVGLGVGVVAGFYFGHRWSKEKLRAEAYAAADEEVVQIRELYAQKEIARANVEKPSMEKIIEERGYSRQVPEIPERERPLPAPVPISLARVPVSEVADEVAERVVDKVADIITDLPAEPASTHKSMHAGWDNEKELRGRTPGRPYVIHQNEYTHSEPEYSKVVYTYYELDDVFVDDEDDSRVRNADDALGMANLKFGHGSDDTDVVYIRNDRFQTDVQVCRVRKSYEEEVLGLDGVGDDNGDDD